MTSPIDRIAILTYETPQSNVMNARLLAEFPSRVTGVVRSAGPLGRDGLVASARFLWQRTCPGFVFRKGSEVLIGSAELILGLRDRYPSTPSVQRLASDLSVPVVHANDINSPRVKRTLQSWNPDLIVSVYLDQIMDREVLESARFGAINVHGSLLPKNRGLFTAFWALANGDSATGSTVHWAEPHPDKGPIIVQESISITPEDTVVSLAHRTAERGADLLVEAIKLIETGDPPRHSQDHLQATYVSWPRREDINALKHRGRRYGSLEEMWRAATS